jgi:hypothetical protein
MPSIHEFRSLDWDPKEERHGDNVNYILHTKDIELDELRDCRGKI